MVVVVFRFHPHPDADLEEMGALTENMAKLVGAMSGFLGLKDYAAQDGEVVVVAEFDSIEAVDEWKAHPDHVVAQRRGREEFFADYRIQVCDVIRTREFTAS